MFKISSHRKQVFLNLAGHIIDGSFWAWGFNTFSSIEVVIPWLISSLGGSSFHIGLIPLVSRMGSMLPQLLSAPFIERAPRKKVIVLTLGSLMRLPVLAIVFSLYHGFQSHQLPSPEWILFLYLIFIGLGGFLSPAWLDFLADTIPLQYRGRQFAIRICIGGALGVVSGPLILAPIQHHYPFPLNAAIVIGIMFVLISISILGLIMPKELTTPVNRRHESLRHYYQSHVPGIIRKDSNFRVFLCAKALMLAASDISTSFFYIYGIERFQLAESWTGTFTAILMLGTLSGTFFIGAFADRYGHRLNLIAGCFTLILADLLALFAPHPWVYAFVFFLLSLYRGIEIVSFLGLSIEFSSPKDRPTYIAISNSLMFPVLFMGVFGGFLYQRIGGYSVFWMSILFAFAAMGVNQFRLHEPRKAHYIIPEVPPER